jgi:hypothetical protein
VKKIRQIYCTPIKYPRQENVFKYLGYKTQKKALLSGLLRYSSNLSNNNSFRWIFEMSFGFPLSN